MKIGNKLKIIRHIKDISQLEFAEACGLTQSDISKIEADGKKFVPTSVLMYLVSINVNLNWLFDAEENDRPIFLEETNQPNENIQTRDSLKLRVIQQTFDATNSMNSNALIEHINYLEQLRNNSKA